MYGKLRASKKSLKDVKMCAPEDKPKQSLEKEFKAEVKKRISKSNILPISTNIESNKYKLEKEFLNEVRKRPNWILENEFKAEV